MQGFLREMWRVIRSPHSGEIRHHATIGAAIALTLVLMDYVRERLPPYVLALRGLRVALLLLVAGTAAYVIAFVGIAAFELWLRTPIHLGDIGVVDGHWVYSMQDVNSTDSNVHMGAIIHIRSSGFGFRIKGRLYQKVPDTELSQIEFVPVGEFKADGTPWNESRVYYYYSGKEDGVDDSGVGYYSFDDRDSILILDGVVAGSRRGPNKSVSIRLLTGRRAFTDEERSRLGIDDERLAGLLLAHLRSVIVQVA